MPRSSRPTTPRGRRPASARRGTRGARPRRRTLVDGRWQFRPTVGIILFGLIFFGVGLAVGVLLGAKGIAHPDRQHPLLGVAFPLFFGAAFGGVGAYILWNNTRPIVFDRGRGVYTSSISC